MNKDFVFGLPKEAAGNAGIVVFVERLDKMVDLLVVPDTFDCVSTATLFVDRVFSQPGHPESKFSD